MYNSDLPTRADLPTSAQLARSTVVALLAAAAILTVVVLPSEYGIDPTGAGRLLGLTQMGEIKRQLAAEAAAENPPAQSDPPPAATPSVPPPAPAATAAAAQGRSDEITFDLRPGEGAEYKLVMQRGAKAAFAWSAAGGAVNFDAHGSAPGQRISYERGRGVSEDAGELVAAFDGQHGWFFRNRTDQPVSVTLTTSGDYRELKRVM